MSDETIKQNSDAEVVSCDCANSENYVTGCCSCRKEPRGKLYCHNWLAGISDSADYDVVEVQFKNTRKGFYKNSQHIDLQIGDMVAVEASPGHDIGQVTMVGKLVVLQMRKANLHPDYEIKRVFRKARQSDLEKYEEAKAREHDTMIRSRRIAEELELNMKIGDVEYQGDGGKAIFYYIADERVDFRKLIRVLADAFKVRIEMKQIGARQEAGRIGGIGPCGRPLCCSSWMTNFVSVGTSAARFQDISMNPQKLAGQCAKLKCCLNFEVDVYMESAKKMPPKDAVLETKDASYFQFKADILKREITYSTDKQMPVNCVTLDASRAFEIIALNKRGIKVDKLEREGSVKEEKREFVELVGQDNINRFDKAKRKKKKSKQNRQDKPETRERRKQEPRQNTDLKDNSKLEIKETRKSDFPEQKAKQKGSGDQNKQRRKPKRQQPQNGGEPNSKKNDENSAKA